MVFFSEVHLNSNTAWFPHLAQKSSHLSQILNSRKAHSPWGGIHPHHLLILTVLHIRNQIFIFIISPSPPRLTHICSNKMVMMKNIHSRAPFTIIDPVFKMIIIWKRIHHRLYIENKSTCCQTFRFGRWKTLYLQRRILNWIFFEVVGQIVFLKHTKMKYFSNLNNVCEAASFYDCGLLCHDINIFSEVVCSRLMHCICIYLICTVLTN